MPKASLRRSSSGSHTGLRTTVAALVRGGAFVLALGVLAVAQEAAATKAPVVHGRIDVHEGLRIVHTWGTPEERGFAHGFLLGPAISASMRTEFAARYARRQKVLEYARRSLPRMIAWPESIEREIEAVYAGWTASGADRAMPEFERDFDLVDLKVANALDVFALFGCSGFTLEGEHVLGGGVLSGRNFDWPFTGKHLLDETVVLVQHHAEGRATAAVTWPGFVGVVTGVNQDGVAAYLHVGSGDISLMPQPESWPTAVAARTMLDSVRGDRPEADFAFAEKQLEWTSPPVGFLTRLVLPKRANGQPAHVVFEVDHDTVVRATLDGPCVVTNHFQGRADGRGPSGDSQARHRDLRLGVDRCLTTGDHRVSVEEGWEFLKQVQRGRGHAFGTLHALVFRAEPWCFELRVAELSPEGRIVPAPEASRRWSVPRAVLFAPPTAAEGAASGR